MILMYMTQLEKARLGEAWFYCVCLKCKAQTQEKILLNKLLRLGI